MTWPKLFTLAGTLLGGFFVILQITFGSLEKRVESIDTRLAAATADIKKIVEVGGQIDGVGKAMDTKIDGMETAVLAKLDSFETSLGSKIDGLGASLGGRLDGIQASVNAVGNSLDEVRSKIRMEPDDVP